LNGAREAKRAPFPWKDTIGFGLGVLKLSPAAFWALTPRELSMAHSALFGEQAKPCNGGRLRDLMQQFPDTF
jgi:uncharacterized phage protein (TIGR02216 family)